MKGFYEVRFGSEVFSMRVSGSVSFLDRFELELYERGLTPNKGWKADWRNGKEFTATSATGDQYVIYKISGEDVICVNPVPSYEVVFSGVSRSGDDWRVIDFMGLCYLIERNQGEHNRRFFQIGHPYKNQYEAIARCKQFIA